MEEEKGHFSQGQPRKIMVVVIFFTRKSECLSMERERERELISREMRPES